MGTIALLTLETLFFSKKTIFVGFLSAAVLGMAVVARLMPGFSRGGGVLAPPEFFPILFSAVVLRFVVVVVMLFYGTALIGEEVDGKTLTYLFLRPVSKASIMAGKFLALAWIGAILVLPAVLAGYLILCLGRQPLAREAGELAQMLGVTFVALLAYGSFFALLGAWLRHCLLAGLCYAFGWEGILAYLPGTTRKLTIAYYVQAMLGSGGRGALEPMVTLLLAAAVFFLIAALVLREKEYIMG